MKQHVTKPIVLPQDLPGHENNPRDVHVVVPRHDEYNANDGRLNTSTTVADTTTEVQMRLGRDRKCK